MLGLLELFLVHMHGILNVQGGSARKSFGGLHLRFRFSLSLNSIYLKDHLLLCYTF